MAATLVFISILFSSATLVLSLPSSNASRLASSPSPQTPLFLQGVVKAIAARERWEGEVRVSDLDAGGARVGGFQRYEFHVRVGRTVVVSKLSDEVLSWRKARRAGAVEFGPDLTAGTAVEGLMPVVRDLELEGPLDLRVSGGGDDWLSLHLPALNVTHRHLRRVLVGNGIRVKLEGAQEVSLIHPYDIGLSLNGSLATRRKEHKQFWAFGYSSCAPLLSVVVGGSVSVIAVRNYSSLARVEAAFRSPNTVELLPEKCYNGHFKPASSCLFCSISKRLVLLDKAVGSLLGDGVFQSGSTRFLKAKIMSSTLVKFRLELERDITKNDRVWKKTAEWKTKPTVERHWFEIVARVDGERGLKPVITKKLKRPFIVADSTAWSNVMSNLSFTQFPSVVVPPEALTLDVKW
ncbi:uncharacterized protein LOC103709235 [Phoenix dactylifera]|uniref:Uncharacterized protein LOC103709235 n=1 Tax=Phoenix dactylifera TaxID=42345 RepID=A0A8B7C6I9_PHODC|nr:uncharacterized protein LOC103709235 [Phoenix dactylifera]